MPNLFERNMKLGQIAFDESNYMEAKDYFEEAYELEDDISANVALTKTLIELKEYQPAYRLIKEKKFFYETEEMNQSLYFEVLLQLNLFLEIEKFLMLELDEKRADYEKAYSIAKDYHLMIYQEKFKKLTELILDLPNVRPAEQGRVLKKINYLPKELMLDVAKELLVNEKVTVFSRSELIQQLVQLKITNPITVLTFEGQSKSVVPANTPTLKEVYQSNIVLNQVSEYFEQNNPSLMLEVQKTIKLHLGCLYPFHETVMSPTADWIESYQRKYEMREPLDALSQVNGIQEKLDLEVLNLLSFH